MDECRLNGNEGHPASTTFQETILFGYYSGYQINVDKTEAMNILGAKTTKWLSLAKRSHESIFPSYYRICMMQIMPEYFML